MLRNGVLESRDIVCEGDRDSGSERDSDDDIGLEFTKSSFSLWYPSHDESCYYHTDHGSYMANRGINSSEMHFSKDPKRTMGKVVLSGKPHLA